jgi:hypothetical protein
LRRKIGDAVYLQYLHFVSALRVITQVSVSSLRDSLFNDRFDYLADLVNVMRADKPLDGHKGILLQPASEAEG